MKRWWVKSSCDIVSAIDDFFYQFDPNASILMEDEWRLKDGLCWKLNLSATNIETVILSISIFSPLVDINVSGLLLMPHLIKNQKNIYLSIYQSLFIFYNNLSSPVGWGYRTHKLHLCNIWNHLRVQKNTLRFI